MGERTKQKSWWRMLRLNLNSLTINNFFLFFPRLPKWKSQKSKINQFQTPMIFFFAFKTSRGKTANARAERWNRCFYKYLNYREILIVEASIIFMRPPTIITFIGNLMKFTADDCGKRPNWIKKAERCLGQWVMTKQWFFSFDFCQDFWRFRFWLFVSLIIAYCISLTWDSSWDFLFILYGAKRRHLFDFVCLKRMNWAWVMAVYTCELIAFD